MTARAHLLAMAAPSAHARARSHVAEPLAWAHGDDDAVGLHATERLTGEPPARVYAASGF